jgi:hypothetical protein
LEKKKVIVSGFCFLTGLAYITPQVHPSSSFSNAQLFAPDHALSSTRTFETSSGFSFSITHSKISNPSELEAGIVTAQGNLQMVPVSKSLYHHL